MTGAPFIVEVLDRAGGVRQRVRCEKLPVRVGRGYDCDVIIDDPYLASSHLRLEDDGAGGVVGVDLGSTNGLHQIERRGWFGTASVRGERIALSGDTVLRAGHTLLRVRPAFFAVAKERRDTTAHDWEGVFPALIALAMLGAVAWFDAWVASESERWQAHYSSMFMLIYALALGWAVAWAIANRLIDRRLRFGRHLLITAGGAVALLVASEVLAQLAYSFSLRWVSAYTPYALLTLVAGATYLHTRTMRPHSISLAIRVAGVVAAALIGSVALFQYSKNQTLEHANYVDRLRWPATRLMQTQTPEAFVRITSRLADQVDIRRGELLTSSDGGD